jgi:hypothetical protein
VTNGSSTLPYLATRTQENGLSTSVADKLNNTYPTARTLYNVYRTDTLRASVAGFLNWICDANSAFQKAKDLSTGVNFDTEVNSLITGSYGFIRLSDTSGAPNNSCQLIQAPNISTGGSSTPANDATISGTDISSPSSHFQTGSVPLAIGDSVTGPGVPAGTYVTHVNSDTDITVSLSSGSSTGVTVAFNIHDPAS